MLEKLKALLDGEKYLITLLSNSSALFNENLEDINWVGYYLYQDGKLILGPFQGKVACEMIPLHRGVCGACARAKQTVLVKDVHQFPGHIQCDCASNSEIVIPIMIKGELYGVLDIDSPLVGRFTIEDQDVLEQCIKALEAKIEELL